MWSCGIEETRAFARLPGLDIAIAHRGARGAEEGQVVVVALRAAPSWDALGRPFGVTDPFLLWARLAHVAWASWLGWFATAALPPPTARDR